MRKERLIYFDLLRILACFSVVMLHSAAECWYYIPIDSVDWLIVNAYNAMVRFGVPIFVMISGALFLASDKEIDLKRLYKHNIFRLIIVYLVWSALYGIYDCFQRGLSGFTWNDVLIEIYSGRYHLWYLPMIIGFYMLVPIIKKWLQVAEKREVEYFLALFLVFQIVQNTINAIKPTEWMSFLWRAVEIQEKMGYLGYFVLGYYIVHYGIERKWHKWIYLGGVGGGCANIFVSSYKSLQKGYADSAIYDSYGIFTLLIILALFLFFVEKVSEARLPEKVCGAVKEFSMATLGIYLMHLMWMEFFQSKGINSMTVTPIVGVPLLALVCFLLSYICAALLRRIPFVGKYIC